MGRRDTGVTDHSLRRQVKALAQDVDLLRRELTLLRRPSVNHAPAVFLAVTIEDGTYPAPPANTFKIAFADSKFTRAEGNQTVTTTKRNATGTAFQDYARTINDLWLPKETLVAVLDTPAYASGDGHWFIITCFPIKPLVRFTLAADLAKTDASKTATISSQIGYGFASALTGAGAITVHNMPAEAGNYTFEGDTGNFGYAYHDSDDDYYIIQMEMECP